MLFLSEMPCCRQNVVVYIPSTSPRSWDSREGMAHKVMVDAPCLHLPPLPQNRTQVLRERCHCSEEREKNEYVRVPMSSFCPPKCAKNVVNVLKQKVFGKFESFGRRKRTIHSHSTQVGEGGRWGWGRGRWGKEGGMQGVGRQRGRGKEGKGRGWVGWGQEGKRPATGREGNGKGEGWWVGGEGGWVMGVCLVWGKQ